MTRVTRRTRASRTSVAASCAAVVLLSGCQSGVGGDAATSSPPSSSSAPIAPTTTSSNPSTSSSAPRATTTTTADASSSSVPAPATGGLGLGDFFNPPDYWEERRYDIADRSDVEGIGTVVSSCSDTSAQVLEIRLSNSFRELRFSAAQANDSLRSDQQLSVQVVANNQQVDIRSVPFNEVRPFTIDVAGVNALQIRLSLDPAVPSCRSSVIGVLQDFILS